MMDISHLYHDATFGDPTLELDVKEQLKTREVNAREERNLQRMHQSYDREKFICEKNTAWERWKIGQSLHGIWERSPRLEKRLALEKARIEALERSILYRNYRMNTNMSNFSSTSRSFSSVSLKPLHDQKKTYQGKQQPQPYPKRKDRFSKEGDENNSNNNNNSNLERGVHRQADFVKRSEHSIKALAKLNWRQQTRRRDHEKFKEELFFHSKPVIEKARVILRGRSDIDVENMFTDFENILLPPVKKPANFNSLSYKAFSKHQGTSNLYEKNVLRLTDSVEKKLNSLVPVEESSETEEKDTTETEMKQQRLSGKDEGDVVEGDTTDSKGAAKDNSLQRVNGDIYTLNNSSTSPGSNETFNTKDGSERDRLPSLGDSKNFINSENSPNHISGSETIHESNDSKIPKSSHQGNNPSDDNTTNHNSPEQQLNSPNNSHPFSPSSISQIIIEEEEEDFEEERAFVKTEDGLDVNNNDIPENDLSRAKSNTSEPGGVSLFTMTCTMGLPQIWKQNKKPKEKVAVEVSAAAIARKHRRKRKDRW